MAFLLYRHNSSFFKVLVIAKGGGPLTVSYHGQSHFYDGDEKSSHYRLYGTRVHTKLRKSMDELDKKIKELEAEKKEIKKQLKQTKKKDPNSFLENVLLYNHLSAKDIETHGPWTAAVSRA